VRHVSLVGPPGFIKPLLAACAEAGVTTLLANPLTRNRGGHIDFVERLLALLP
jgi:hypothetical protein